MGQLNLNRRGCERAKASGLCCGTVKDINIVDLEVFVRNGIQRNAQLLYGVHTQDTILGKLGTDECVDGGLFVKDSNWKLHQPFDLECLLVGPRDMIGVRCKRRRRRKLFKEVIRNYRNGGSSVIEPFGFCG